MKRRKELAGRDFIGVTIELTDGAFRQMKHALRCVVIPPGGGDAKVLEPGDKFTFEPGDFADKHGNDVALHPEVHVKSGAWRIVPKPKPKPEVKTVVRTAKDD